MSHIHVASIVAWRALSILLRYQFNDTVALNKLRATLGEVRLSQADDTAKLSALWGRLTLAKQAGRQVDLRATIFGCLASEAEREADKLVRR